MITCTFSNGYEVSIYRYIVHKACIFWNEMTSQVLIAQYCQYCMRRGPFTFVYIQRSFRVYITCIQYCACIQFMIWGWKCTAFVNELNTTRLYTWTIRVAGESLKEHVLWYVHILGRICMYVHTKYKWTCIFRYTYVCIHWNNIEDTSAAVCNCVTTSPFGGAEEINAYMLRLMPQVDTIGVQWTPTPETTWKITR